MAQKRNSNDYSTSNADLMKSSLRGIMFNDDKKTNDKFSSINTNNTSVNGDSTYNKMQNNLKSLQDKIKDLECKLNRVNDNEEDEVLKEMSQNKKSQRSSRMSKRSIIKPMDEPPVRGEIPHMRS